MSDVSGSEEPVVSGNVETPEAVKNTKEDAPSPNQGEIEDEDDVYEDASDAGEVFMRRAVAHPSVGWMNCLPPPGPPMVSTPPPSIKPEMYEGTTDWSE